MPLVANIIDAKRLALLVSLEKNDALKPDIARISKETALTPTQVNKILKQFNEKFGLLSFLPRFDSTDLGFNTFSMILLQIDLGLKDEFEALIKYFEKKPQIISAYKLIGPGKWNYVFTIICKNIEEFDEIMSEILFQNDFNCCIKDKQYIFIKGASSSTKPDRALVLIRNQLLSSCLDDNDKLDEEGLNKIKVFDCLVSKIGLKPNVARLCELTGAHPLTIKSSFDLFNSQNLIKGYSPLVDLNLIKSSYIIFDLFRVDLTGDKFESFSHAADNDNNVIHSSEIYGNPEFNYLLVHFYPSIEEFQDCFKKKYGDFESGVLSQRETYISTKAQFELQGKLPTVEGAMLEILYNEKKNEPTEKNQ